MSGRRSATELEGSSSGPDQGPRAGSGESANLLDDVSEAAKLSLLVLASTVPRGPEDSTPGFVLDLSKHLRSWFHVMVLTPAVRGASESEQMEGVEVRRFRYFWPRSLERLADGAILENLRHKRWLFVEAPFLLLFELIAAYRWARAIRPAVIHAHWFVPQGLVAVIVGWLLKIPVVITSHGGDIYGLPGRLWGALRKALASRCAAVTVVSHDMAANLPGVTSRTGEAPVVLPMGVETSKFHPARRDEAIRQELSIKGPFILFVGRLAEKKGVQYLLEAMPGVLRDFPECALVIVGDGPLRGQLEALADELGIGPNVKFVGGVAHKELPRYCATADVFVGPSVVAKSGDTEGLGVVFAEAIASGCTVVATSVGGTADILIDGQTGVLVEEKSPKALADALCQLLGDDALRERLRSAGLPWVRERFDQQEVADKYARLMRQAISVVR